MTIGLCRDTQLCLEVKGVFAKSSGSRFCSQLMIMTMTTMMVVLVDARTTTRSGVLVHTSSRLDQSGNHFIITSKAVVTPTMKIFHSLLASSTPFLLLLRHATTAAVVSGSSSTPLRRAEVLKGQSRGVNPVRSFTNRLIDLGLLLLYDFAVCLTAYDASIMRMMYC